MGFLRQQVFFQIADGSHVTKFSSYFSWYALCCRFCVCIDKFLIIVISVSDILSASIFFFALNYTYH